MNIIVAIIAGAFTNTQLSLVEACKKNNYKTIVFSRDLRFHDIVDCFYDLSVLKQHEVVQICKENSISGICSVGNENAVSLVAAVNEALHLPGIDTKCAKLCTNKYLMKKVFFKQGIKTPQYAIADIDIDKNSLQSLCTQIGYPVVFKPLDSSGSKGISFVKSNTHHEKALNNIKKHTKKSKFIIEEYIEGESFGVEFAVNRGHILFCLPVGNISLNNDLIDVPIGHYTPFNTEQDYLYSVLSKIISGFYLDDTFGTLDCRVSNNGTIYVLEIGARCGGVLLPELMGLFYNTNVFNCIISLSIGKSIEIFLPSNRSIVARLLFDKDITKRLLEEYTLHSMRDSSNIVELYIDNSKAKNIIENDKETDILNNQVGGLVISSDTVNDLLLALHELLPQDRFSNQIDLEVMPSLERTSFYRNAKERNREHPQITYT